jgi:L-alanine-DL-glutamate epimerase-like enolase superfamily enzyme
MSKPSDLRIVGAEIFLLPVQTRVPLKFGRETLTRVTCARVRVIAEDRAGRRAEGWGETPLSVQWVWPSDAPYAARREALELLCRANIHELIRFDVCGHPMEISAAFQQAVLPRILRRINQRRANANYAMAETTARQLKQLAAANAVEEPEADTAGPIPWLAALVCFSPFDLALHDAFGKLVERPAFETFTSKFLNHDLAAWLKPARGTKVSFAGRYPAEFLRPQRQDSLRAWHLVGGLDPLDDSDLTGQEPNDGYPVLLADWIRADGLKCLKLKLRGNDAEWDFARIVRVGGIALAHAVEWLSVDFNCTVRDPAYVNAILDRLRADHPRLHGMVLYVEQPFPYDLEANRIDVHSLAARKPLFLDESAHDWEVVRLGRELGWNGVALKTCKTLTGALLSACWAQAHGMALMVQDLTNPMLAQIPHLLLAAHVETIMGVETNAMQFYPEASRAEAAVHPGLYRRRNGCVDLASVRGPGLGYRLEEIRRTLPPPDFFAGEGVPQTPRPPT